MHASNCPWMAFDDSNGFPNCRLSIATSEDFGKVEATVPTSLNIRIHVRLADLSPTRSRAVLGEKEAAYVAYRDRDISKHALPRDDRRLLT